jgi:hypothetical protein
MAKISGNLNKEARILVFKESDWSLESNVIKSAGDYEVTGLDSGKKTVVSRIANGECECFGNVDAIVSNPWQSIWNNTKFEVSDGTWTGSAWQSVSSGWSQWLTIDVKSGSTWQEGFRPTKVRATLNPGVQNYIFSGYDVWMSARWDITSDYNSLVEVNITWATQDLTRVHLEISGGSAPQFTLSNLEWYVE